MNMMAQKQIKLTANDKERIVKKVKKYCDMPKIRNYHSIHD